MELFSLNILARVAAIVVIPLLLPVKMQGGDFHRALLLNANYVKPARSNVGGSLVLSHKDVNNSEGGTIIIVGGSVGQGGMQAWGGTTQPLGDVRAVVTRTWDSPRGASGNSTYAGGEVGFGLIYRFSVGYAKRISGP